MGDLAGFVRSKLQPSLDRYLPHLRRPEVYRLMFRQEHTPHVTVDRLCQAITHYCCSKMSKISMRRGVVDEMLDDAAKQRRRQRAAVAL